MIINLVPKPGGPSDKCAACGHARAAHRPGGCGPRDVAGSSRCGCVRFVEAGALPNVVPIGTAKDQRVDDRYLTYGGKTTFQKLPFGSIGVIANARIQVIDSAGRAHELTVAQARETASMFQRAAVVGNIWSEHLSGYNVVRVTRSAEGDVEVTWRGQTHRMRKLRTRDKTRWGHWCEGCRARRTDGVTFYVVADPGKPWNRVKFCEVCEPCVERLANAPTQIRELRPAGAKEATT